ncbi:MAG: DNA-formamidopyrimidine glycosylase [Patescibacteria group bacterium]|nr:DNA-formamidopyrimidine glycosylase [Patescibacteria group bacterium]
MPELPEVTTTVMGLNEVLPNLTITDVWSDYFLRTKNKQTDTIKNKKYFEYFTRCVVGSTVLTTERRGKNILIRLDNNHTILIHMKMTGHLLYGKYRQNLNVWKSDDPFLSDPFNQFIHLVFTLSNGAHLAFSDMRKFAKVTLFETNTQDTISDLSLLGPEPLEQTSPQLFTRQLQKKPNGKIKTVLMDQGVVAGIGNIYSDEILWSAGVHPETVVKNISKENILKIFTAMKKILQQSIQMGGDSMSDYRNIYGKRGEFQHSHKAYRQTGKPCLKKGCSGTIVRKVIGGRSAHFCDTHQTV